MNVNEGVNALAKQTKHGRTVHQIGEPLHRMQVSHETFWNSQRSRTIRSPRSEPRQEIPKQTSRW